MKHHRVLVADDIGTVRTVVRTLLVSLGVPDHQVFEAPDGAAALRLLRDESIDLVITDWNMPGATGLDVLAAVREQSETVPVILLTSNNHRGEVIQAIKAGASDYVVKPFARPVMLEKLAKWLRKDSQNKPST